MVERLDDGQDMDGVDPAGAGAGKDGDEHVLLHGERPRVEGEPPFGERHRPNDRRRQRAGHPPPDRQRHDLHAHRRDRQLVGAVPEELVHKRQEDARDDAEHPRADRQARLRRVVGRRHRQPHLLHRTIIPFFFYQYPYQT